MNEHLEGNKKRLDSIKQSFEDKKRNVVYFLSDENVQMGEIQNRVSELIYYEAMINELEQQIEDQENGNYDLYKGRFKG